MRIPIRVYFNQKSNDLPRSFLRDKKGTKEEVALHAGGQPPSSEDRLMHTTMVLEETDDETNEDSALI